MIGETACRWEARLGFLLGAKIFVDSAVGVSIMEGLRGDLSAAAVSLLSDDEGRDGLLINFLNHMTVLSHLKSKAKSTTNVS